MVILPRLIPYVITLAQLIVMLDERNADDIQKRMPRHPLVQLNRHMQFERLEDACEKYYHQSGPGRPAEYSIGCLVRALIVEWVYQLSLRELEQVLYSDCPFAEMNLTLLNSRQAECRYLVTGPTVPEYGSVGSSTV